MPTKVYCQTETSYDGKFELVCALACRNKLLQNKIVDKTSDE